MKYAVLIALVLLMIPASVHAQATRPQDPLTSPSWSLFAANIWNAQAVTNGQGVTVAVVDVSPPSCRSHAKFVAGIVQMVAPGATIRTYPMLTCEGAWADPLGYAGTIRQTVREGAQVVNMSFVFGEGTWTREAACDVIAEFPGVLFVAGSGNVEGPPLYPAACTGVLSVGSHDHNGSRIPGPAANLLAPGYIITVGYIGSLSGSSAAAPHVSGCAALMLAHKRVLPIIAHMALTESAVHGHRLDCAGAMRLL